MNAFPTSFWIWAGLTVVGLALFVSAVLLGIFWLWEHRR